MWSLDLGSGKNCRAQVCIDINFNFDNPYFNPRPYDAIVAPVTKLNDKIIANLDYPLPIRNNSITTVVIVHTLEHLLKPFECLKEVHRVLKKGGKLKIVVPNAEKNPADKYDEGHVYSFTIYTIKRLVSKLFKVVECKYVIGELDIYIEAIKE